MSEGSRGQRHRRDTQTRRVPWRDIDGIVVVDKPVGLTSNATLQRVRRVYRARKAGHTGSLDPLASGVLPLCFGEATKLSGLLLDASKTYEVTGRLGARTTTGDADGEVLATAPVPALDDEIIEAALGRFRGEIEQIPPMYSALKQGGRRLYELAREGCTVERPPRRVTIHGLELLGGKGPDLSLRVRCSKGTYIRTLVEDLAAALGTCAHVVSLRRTAAGPFGLEDAIGLDALESSETVSGLLRQRLLPPDAGVPGLPSVDLSGQEADRLRHGQKVLVPDAAPNRRPGLTRVYGPDGDFVGLGVADEQGGLAPRRMFRPRGASDRP
jgi:tRNA pseudouridine55 synthase